jgi:hypothetical protein
MDHVRFLSFGAAIKEGPSIIGMMPDASELLCASGRAAHLKIDIPPVISGKKVTRFTDGSPFSP